MLEKCEATLINDYCRSNKKDFREQVEKICPWIKGIDDRGVIDPPEIDYYVRASLKVKVEEKMKEIKRLRAELKTVIGKEDKDRWFRKIAMGVIQEKNGDIATERIQELERDVRKYNWIIHPIQKTKNGVTDEQIQRARDNGNYIDYWKRFVDITNEWATCPNHNDHKPSLLVRKGFAYCFSCGYSTDLIGYLMDNLNYDFKSAVEALQ